MTREQKKSSGLARAGALCPEAFAAEGCGFTYQLGTDNFVAGAAFTPTSTF